MSMKAFKRRLQESLPTLEAVAPAGGLLTPQPSDSEGEDIEPTPKKPFVKSVSRQEGHCLRI